VYIGGYINIVYVVLDSSIVHYQTLYMYFNNHPLSASVLSLSQSFNDSLHYSIEDSGILRPKREREREQSIVLVQPLQTTNADATTHTHTNKGKKQLSSIY